MFDFHEKRKLRSILYSKITLIILAALCAVVALSAYERFQIERQMAERRHEVEKELSALHERAVTLEEKVLHFEDERGLEAEIRTRFDVAREGEQVVIIVDSDDSNPVESVEFSGHNADSEVSFWRRIKFW